MKIKLLPFAWFFNRDSDTYQGVGKSSDTFRLIFFFIPLSAIIFFLLINYITWDWININWTDVRLFGLCIFSMMASRVQVNGEQNEQ